MALMTHAERITEVRFLLGDPSTSTLSDAVIDRFLTRQEEYFGTDLDNQCYVLYNTCLDCLIYLINKGVSSAGGTVAGGELTSREETVGAVKIKETYSSTSSSSSSSSVGTWSDLYDYFKKHPEFVCKSLKKYITNGIVIGGVERSEKERIYEDSESFGNGYAENQEVLDFSFYDKNSDPYYFPNINIDEV